MLEIKIWIHEMLLTLLNKELSYLAFAKNRISNYDMFKEYDLLIYWYLFDKFIR